MDFAYRPGDWHDFYAALATAYAALLGLFFVAISLHPREVGEHPLLRSRARISLVGLAMLLVIALDCLLPQASVVALGVELVVLWSIWAVVLSINQIRLIKLLAPTPAGVWLRDRHSVVDGAVRDLWRCVAVGWERWRHVMECWG